LTAEPLDCILQTEFHIVWRFNGDAKFLNAPFPVFGKRFTHQWRHVSTISATTRAVAGCDDITMPNIQTNVTVQKKREHSSDVN